jgi:hypothetical protein
MPVGRDSQDGYLPVASEAQSQNNFSKAANSLNCASLN